MGQWDDVMSAAAMGQWDDVMIEQQWVSGMM